MAPSSLNGGRPATPPAALGAIVTPEGVVFTVWAPAHRRGRRGPRRTGRPIPMEPVAGGYFTATVAGCATWTALLVQDLIGASSRSRVAFSA